MIIPCFNFMKLISTIITIVHCFAFIELILSHVLRGGIAERWRSDDKRWLEASIRYILVCLKTLIFKCWLLTHLSSTDLRTRWRSTVSWRRCSGDLFGTAPDEGGQTIRPKTSVYVPNLVLRPAHVTKLDRWSGFIIWNECWKFWNLIGISQAVKAARKKRQKILQIVSYRCRSDARPSTVSTWKPSNYGMHGLITSLVMRGSSCPAPALTCAGQTELVSLQTLEVQFRYNQLYTREPAGSTVLFETIGYWWQHSWLKSPRVSA